MLCRQCHWAIKFLLVCLQKEGSVMTESRIHYLLLMDLDILPNSIPMEVDNIIIEKKHKPNKAMERKTKNSHKNRNIKNQSKFNAKTNRRANSRIHSYIFISSMASSTKTFAS